MLKCWAAHHGLISLSHIAYAQGALVKMFAARELGMDSEAVEEQLHALAALLPDIGEAPCSLSATLSLF